MYKLEHCQFLAYTLLALLCHPPIYQRALYLALFDTS